MGKIKLTKDYLLEKEDFMKIVSMYVPNSGFRRSLIEYILRYTYRNSYGQVEDSLAEGELTDMSRGYPRHLVNPDSPYPVSNYGFVNIFSSRQYNKLGINIKEGSEDELRDKEYKVSREEEDELYSNIPFNVNKLMKQDLIVYFREFFEDLHQANDFVLVEISHQTKLFRDYREKEVDLISRVIMYEDEKYRRKQNFIRGSVDLLDKGYRDYS